MPDNIIYFELNNWIPGTYYPDAEPFTSWMGNDKYFPFEDEEFVKKNKLCVVMSIIDMSINFCITATEEWVQLNCPDLFTLYDKFLREVEPGEHHVYGQFGDQFLEYKEENIGVHTK